MSAEPNRNIAGLLRFLAMTIIMACAVSACANKGKLKSPSQIEADKVKKTKSAGKDVNPPMNEEKLGAHQAAPEGRSDVPGNEIRNDEPAPAPQPKEEGVSVGISPGNPK